jgi:hypothetical protein
MRREPLFYYPASLPERGLRAGAAVAGGLLQETSEVLLPRALRGSRVYQATVGRLLRIVVELIGGVEMPAAADAIPAGELALRKTAGNAIELVGLVGFGASPLWVLAAISDLTGGTRAYLQALVGELRRSGVLGAETHVRSAEELLGILERSTGVASDVVDVPPLDVAALRTSWEALRASVQGGWHPDPGELAAIFADLQRVARAEGSSLLTLSGLLAAGALRAGGQLGTTHILDYYRETLRRIAEEGLPRYLWRITRPYLAAVGRQLDPRRPSYTERWLARRDRPPAPAS